jgi:CheY-like chemotaxis protein
MLSEKERKVAKIGHPIRVLIIEDSEDDTELMLRHLRKGGFYPKFRRVQSAAGLQNALKNEKWELILCDHNMPGFDSVAAQNIVNKKHPFIPFMLISDSIPAGVADTVKKNGARATISKSNLSLLIPAVVKEIRAARDAKRSAIQNQSAQQKVLSNKIRQGKYGTTISLFSDSFSDPASKHPRVSKNNGLGNGKISSVNEPKKPVKNILIVEDELIQSILLEKLIRSLGYRVIGKASSGADAIKMALNLQPDLITMDISLQDNIDGIMATSAIQDKCMIPVIYISGNSDKYNLERAEKTNYIDFIPKPVCKESLSKSFAKAEALKADGNR